MKLFSIILINSKENFIISGEYELNSFGYFQRGSIKEFMNFFSKTIAERTKSPGDRQSIDNEDYRAHVFKRFDNLSIVLICDKEYPSRVAFALMSKVVDEFCSRFNYTSSSNSTAMNLSDLLQPYLVKYQDPSNADDLTKIQRELDDTKIIMHKTIEGVLQRGEQLEDLAAKSDELSTASKAFYQAAKSNNSCCKLM